MPRGTGRSGRIAGWARVAVALAAGLGVPFAGTARAQRVCPCATPTPAPAEEADAWTDTTGAAWTLVCTNAGPAGDFAWVHSAAGADPKVLGRSAFVDAENRVFVVPRSDGSVAYLVHASADGGSDDGQPWDAILNVYRAATGEKLRLCLSFQGGAWVESLAERVRTTAADFAALSPADANGDCVPEAGFDELLAGLYAQPFPALPAQFEARVRVRAVLAGADRGLCWDVGPLAPTLLPGDRVRLRELTTADVVQLDPALAAADTPDGLELAVVAPLALVHGATFATVAAAGSAASPCAVEVAGAEAFYDQLFALHPGTPIDALGFSGLADLRDAPGYAGSLGAVDLAPVPAVTLIALGPTGSVDTTVVSVDTQPFGTTNLGLAGVPSLSGLSVEPFTGTLFASSGQSSGGLLGTLDPGTGLFALIGATGATAVPGLAFAPDGTLYGTADTDGAGGSDALVRIDTSTGLATVVGPLVLPPATPVPGLDALAFDPRGRQLYATTGFGFDGTPGDLVRVDPASGAVTLLGSLADACTGAGVTGTLAGLAFDASGNLYGSLGGGDGRLIRIDVGARTFDVLGFATVGSASDVAVVAPGGTPPRVYCTGKTNSLGCLPFVGTAGVASATLAEPFTLSANDVLPAELGFLLYSTKKANLDFHGAKLCVKGPTRLLPAKQAKRVCAPPCGGRLVRNFNKTIQAGGDPRLTAGAVVRAQWRQRDPGDPAGFGDGLTDAVQFHIAP